MLSTNSGTNTAKHRRKFLIKVIGIFVVHRRLLLQGAPTSHVQVHVLEIVDSCLQDFSSLDFKKRIQNAPNRPLLRQTNCPKLPVRTRQQAAQLWPGT